MSLKNISLKQKLRQALEKAAQDYQPLPSFEIERAKIRAHGELATNLAMILARQHSVGENKKNPQTIAQDIISKLNDQHLDWLESISVAGGGFLNFVIKPSAWQEELKTILESGEDFGKSDEGQGKSINIEFVSANPTGPIHIGNARGGPLGDALASLLKTIGYDVTKEYYVNDVGGQIDRLGESILYWIDEKDNPEAPGPAKDSNCYQGEYVKELAQIALRELGEKISDMVSEVEPSSDPSTGSGCPASLIKVLGKFGIKTLLKQIKDDCDLMGITFDSWVNEKEILGSGKTEAILKALIEKNVTKKHEGALWLADASNELLNDRECVLEKSDGRPTYFANDIAYHVEKYKKGYDRLINVWGSNHHGHVPRVKAAVQSLGYDPEKIETVLYQYVRVKRGNDAVKMSKRGGNFVLAREVLDEVGRDAFRFFLLMRAPESHLDFDLELAKSQSQENPVYYVQYAHARLCSIMKKAAQQFKEQGIELKDHEIPDLKSLNLPEELEMIRVLLEYPEEILRAAKKLEPHRISFYILEVAKMFQSYYSKAKTDDRYRVLSGDVDSVKAKLYFCRSIQHTLASGLKLLGITAPTEMHHEEI